MENYNTDNSAALSTFLAGKSAISLALFDHFISEFEKIAPITLHPAKTMIGIANAHRRIAWITQFGKILSMWCSRSNRNIPIIYASQK